MNQSPDTCILRWVGTGPPGLTCMQGGYLPWLLIRAPVISHRADDSHVRDDLSVWRVLTRRHSKSSDDHSGTPQQQATGDTSQPCRYESTTPKIGKDINEKEKLKGPGLEMISMLPGHAQGHISATMSAASTPGDKQHGSRPTPSQTEIWLPKPGGG